MPAPEDRRIHVPVMADAVLRHLGLGAGGRVLDGTIGAGGHAFRVLTEVPGSRVVGLDRDAQILEVARRRLQAFGDRVALHHASFEDASAVAPGPFDAVLLDLGVSSLQLDDPDRGFSFDLDGPLDMRMDPSASRSAADLVNRGSPAELLHAIGTLGEEPHARRVVDAIVAARRQAPLRRTRELADLVARVARGGRKHHPATRTFQGLRMATNDEAGVLERGLPRLFALLKPGGRMAVIAFHSGEDRLVKQCFRSLRDQGLARLITRKPEEPDAAEVARNPRARSARLRVTERVVEPA